MGKTTAKTTKTSGAPIIVLHRTQLGENIGTTARAMGNFGLSELRLASARRGWNRARAAASARAGGHILEAAREYASLDDALADVHYVVAASARVRDMAKPVLSPQAMARKLAREGRRHACAILLGPESSGLDNAAVARADALVQIPSAPKHHSLNLAQAVLLLAYAWRTETSARPPASDEAALQPVAPRRALRDFLAHWEAALTAAGYLSPKERAPVMMQGLTTMFVRARLSEQELRSLRGAVNALLLFPHKGARSKQADELRASIKGLAGAGKPTPKAKTKAVRRRQPREQQGKTRRSHQ